MVCKQLSKALGKKICYNICQLPISIMGFVYYSEKGRYYIVINKNITCEYQKEVFLHEVKHIIKDLPDGLYVLDMDMQYSKLEKQADSFAKAVAETAASYFD